jgi:two-component system nitrogen regulation sensor histidine kinase NtrY
VNLRSKLLLAFLAATLLPLGGTLWITTSLLEQSLRYSSTEELDRVSNALKETARLLYQSARRDLRDAVVAGRVAARRFPESTRRAWPTGIQDFWNSGESERFSLSGTEGDQLDYLVRGAGEVRLYTRRLDNIRMEPLSAQYSQARRAIEDRKSRDLRRGFTYTLILLSAAVWLLSLAALAFLAHRLSRPIRDLTTGLSGLAAGRYETRVPVQRRDEVGLAIEAFNDMAAQLQQSRDRLVYLTQVASWQLLARKMAHELKNSLTPIRLTVEEIVAREPGSDFLKQAAQIVTEEIETLQRRVRAFSEFSGEPTPKPELLEVNAMLRERVEFLRVAHPGIDYELAFSLPGLRAFADPDHVKGIITNLLQNAAEAIAENGHILIVSGKEGGKVIVDVHDSGSGLNEEARRSLFEPTISFKEHGMGLGLSISRKNALLAGGDLLPIDSRLGGAAFRLVLPVGMQR